MEDNDRILLEQFCAGNITLGEYTQINEGFSEGIGKLKQYIGKSIAKLKTITKKVPKAGALLILSILTILIYNKFTPQLAKKTQQIIKKRQLDLALKIGAFGDIGMAEKESTIILADILSKVQRIPISTTVDVIARHIVSSMYDPETNTFSPRVADKRKIAQFSRGKLVPREEFKDSDLGGVLLDLKKEGVKASDVFASYSKIKVQINKELRELGNIKDLETKEDKLSVKTIQNIHNATEKSLYNYLQTIGLLSLNPEKDYYI